MAAHTTYRTSQNSCVTDTSRSESGSCGIPATFSSVRVLPSPTSAEYSSSLFGWFTGTMTRSDFSGRARPSCGLGLHGTVWIMRPRHPGDLPVLVYVVFQRARGLRLRRTDEPLASSAAHRVAFRVPNSVGILVSYPFRSSIPGPPVPLSTLQV